MSADDNISPPAHILELLRQKIRLSLTADPRPSNPTLTRGALTFRRAIAFASGILHCRDISLFGG